MDFLNQYKTTSKTKRLEQSLHQEQTDAVTLRNATVFGLITDNVGAVTSFGANAGVYTDSDIELDRREMQPDQIVRLTGIGADNAGRFVDVRLVTRNDADTLDWTTVAIVAHNNPVGVGAVTTVFDNSAAATSFVSHTNGVVSPIDGEAPEGIFFEPSFVYNLLRRSREAVEIGKHTLADALLADVHLQQQIFLKWFKVIREYENGVLFNTAPWIEANALKSQRMNFGGIPWYLRNHAAGTATNLNGGGLPAEYTGNNLSINVNGMSAENITSMIDDALRACVSWGTGKDRILIGSPDFISMVSKVFVDQVSVEKTNFGIPMHTDSLWETKKIDLHSGTLHLIATQSLAGKRLPILGTQFSALEDNTRNVDSQAAANFGYILDPNGLEMPVHEVDGEAQELRVRLVDPINNSSFRKAEIDGTLGFHMKLPQANGTLILENI